MKSKKEIKSDSKEKKKRIQIQVQISEYESVCELKSECVYVCVHLRK